MKVKRNSWHYTLYCFCRQLTGEFENNPLEILSLLARRSTLRRDYQPSSLCRYFWFVIACLSLLVPLLLFLDLLLGIITAAAVVIILPPMWLYDKYREFRPKNKTAKQPSMVRTYIKARKQKVCPLIEVVD